MFLVLFSIVYFMLSERVAILDMKTLQPMMEHTEKEGRIVSDYVYRAVANPLLVLGCALITLALVAYDESRKPYRMELFEMLKKMNKVERDKWSIPSLSELKPSDMEFSVLEGINKGIITFKGEMADGKPLTLYVDMNSNFKDFATSPVIGYNRTENRHMPYHIERLKQLCKKQVLSIPEAMAFISQIYNINERELMLAIEKIKKHETDSKEEGD